MVMTHGRHVSFFAHNCNPSQNEWRQGDIYFFHVFLSNLQFSAKLTCNHCTHKLAVVANIVLCAVYQPAGLVIAAWHTDFNCFLLKAAQADVFDSHTPLQWWVTVVETIFRSSLVAPDTLWRCGLFAAVTVVCFVFMFSIIFFFQNVLSSPDI